MSERDLISRKMREHYESVWQDSDAWDLESSPYEQARYERLLTLLAGRRYGRALEIGCGAGAFSRRLAGLADRLVALDIAAAAIDRARQRSGGAASEAVSYRVADVMTFDLGAEGPWDLVVLSEVIYCLGWLYPFFDVAWFATRLFEATSPCGRLLLANTLGRPGQDWLLLPCLTNTYRDLFRNVGYDLEAEERFPGIKDGVEFEVLISLFTRKARE